MSWRTDISSSTARQSGCARTPTFRNSISAARAGNVAVIGRSSNIAGGGDGMAEVEVERLSLRFGGLTVLDQVSFSIQRGELFALIGFARTFQHGELFPNMSVLDNLMTGRHTRIRSNPLSEMLFLPSVQREEVRNREAVEHIIELVELERFRHAPVAGLPFGIQKL